MCAKNFLFMFYVYEGRVKMIEPISRISFSSQAPEVLKPLDNASVAAPQVTAPINAMPQANSTLLQGPLPRDTYNGATASAKAVGEATSAATTTGKMLNTSTAFTAALRGDSVAKRQLDVVI